MVIIKGFVSLIFLFFVIKILGKKQISELNIFDYVIGISLGNIAAEMTISDDISILKGFSAMVIYGIVSLFVSYITTKSILARRFISGYPIVLIDHGKISKEQLKKVKLDINDLLQDARENGYFDISEIECAVMEVSGKVSFLPKYRYSNVVKEDLNLMDKNRGLVANLVLDGNIMINNLRCIDKDEKWLIRNLKKLGYKEISNLFLVTCDSNYKLSVYLNDYHIKKNILE